ncbi:MAG: hypothetical protein H7Z74_12540 [Anaerolineae bacterium]|nr:hypothetical protein [Gemmatimonadaceae bacterium]
MIARVVGCAALTLAAGALPAQQRFDTSQARRVTISAGSVTRNASPLRAVQVLEYRPVGAAARVRFEWEQVTRAREYRLVGRWTGSVSWTVQTREYKVTPRNATTWTPRSVTLDVTLPEGNHSWRLVAVFGPNDARAVSDSALLSFAIH